MSGLPPGYELRDGSDPIAAHAFLTGSYWAEGISLDDVRKSFDNSLQLSIWHDGGQIGMVRVITDHVTFAYLADVYVLPDHCGRGFAGAMLDHLGTHPTLQDITRWALFTKDAQTLYSRHGWKEYPWPERMMIMDSRNLAE